MATIEQAPETAIEKAVEKAQAAIRKTLIDLEEETQQKIDSVEVDTRNFADLRTEVWLREKKA